MQDGERSAPARPEADQAGDQPEQTQREDGQRPHEPQPRVPHVLNRGGRFGQKATEAPRPDAQTFGPAAVDAGHVVIHLAHRRAADRRGPAEAPQRIPDQQRRRRQGARNPHDRRRRKPQPAAIKTDRFGHADGLRPRHVEGLAHRRAGLQRRHDRRAQIGQGDGTERLIAADHRAEQGKGRQRPDQTCPAERGPIHHQRRAQDQPVQIGGANQSLSLGLGAGVGCARRIVGAHGGNMDQSAYARRFAGLDQGARPLDMGQRRAVARPVLQHADAVHHSVDAVQQRRPGLRLGQLREVRPDPVKRRRPASGFVWSARPGPHRPARH